MPNLTISIETDDSDAVDKLRPLLAQSVREFAYRAEALMKTSMSGPKHGRTYSKGAIRKTRSVGGKRERVTVGHKIHRASAPGEAPARRSGHLVNSIRTRFENKGLTGIVSANAEYAVYLEFGAPPALAPRPFAAPALEAVRQPFVASVRKVFNP